MQEISNRLEALQGKSEFSNEEVTEISALGTEFEDLQAKVEAHDTAARISALSKGSAGRKAPVAAAPAAPKQPEAKKENKFANYGEYLLATRKYAAGEVDARFANTMTTSVDAEGGFLVPPEFLTDVVKVLESDESLLNRCKKFIVSSNNLTLPIDESLPWTGGVQASWIGENIKYTDSTPNTLSQASFKLHKLGALVFITDELIEDAVALESYVRGMAPQAILHKVNEAIINGNGVNKPKGILGSTFAVSVPKETSQVADTIVARNVIKMYSRMIPSSRGSSVWLINAGCEEQLRTMKDDNGNFIYLAAGSQMNAAPYALLLGRPVIPMLGALPAIGDKGDIIFADFNYYYAVLKSAGMKQAVSSHLKFDQDVQAYKFTLRIDGGVPFTKPVKTQYGNYEMSAFVLLDERA